MSAIFWLTFLCIHAGSWRQGGEVIDGEEGWPSLPQPLLIQVRPCLSHSCMTATALADSDRWWSFELIAEVSFLKQKCMQVDLVHIERQQSPTLWLIEGLVTLQRWAILAGMSVCLQIGMLRLDAEGASALPVLASELPYALV